VRALLGLKEAFKSLTLTDWKPDLVLAKPDTNNNKAGVSGVNLNIFNFQK
jgi:hypothetical protein